MNYEYLVTARPPVVGGGYRLQLLEDGEEVGGGVFPGAASYGTDAATVVGQLLDDDAFVEAMEEGEEWLSSKSGTDE